MCRCSVTAHAIADAVLGAGAAADLVEEHEAPRGRRVQNRARLRHLDHEGDLAADEIVARAHAREHAVDDPDACALLRARSSDLREQDKARSVGEW